MDRAGASLGGSSGAVARERRRSEASGPIRQIPDARTAGQARLFRLEGNRLFWFVTILAATAITAWIVTRLLILNGAGGSLTPNH